MSPTDIILLVIIVSALIVGFVWGPMRSVLFVGAWLVAFMAGAYLRIPVGSWLARQWTNFNPEYGLMAGFGLIYVGILLAAPVVIYVGSTGEQSISRWQLLDDVAGGVLAVAVVILGIAGMMAVLGSFYDDPEAAAGGPHWTSEVYRLLQQSPIAGAIERTLVPLIGVVLGPVVPAEVRGAMS